MLTNTLSQRESTLTVSRQCYKSIAVLLKNIVTDKP